MRTRVLVAGGVLVLLGVAACSGSGSSGSAGGDTAGKVAAGVPAPASSAAGSSAAGFSANGGTTSDRATTTSLVSSGAKIRRAEMTVSVKKGTVAQQANAADAVAARVGGEVDSDDRATGRYPSAELVLLVPPAALTSTLTALSRLGREDSRSLSTRDVTTQVADVNSRVVSARAAIARLTSLYARGGKVSDVIAIESELARRQADLESLEAQQKALAAQTSFATITLSLRTLAPPPVHKHTASGHSGIVGGLVRGWHAFTHTAGAVATGVATALPFLVLLVLALLAARVLWTRLGRRPAPVPSTDPAP